MKNLAAYVGVTIATIALVGCNSGQASSTSSGDSPSSPSLGSVMLTWEVPNQNVDGSCLTDLSGYRAYRGPAAGNYTDSETVMFNAASCSNSGTSNACGTIQTCTYTVNNLPSGSWHFSLQAFNANGDFSGYSNEASTVVP